MRFFEWSHDGHKDSGVDAFFIIEIKKLFSIAFLRFGNGESAVYHSHAFDALTWSQPGVIMTEVKLEDDILVLKNYAPSLIPKLTRKKNKHKVVSIGTNWALTLRGPWEDYWEETDVDNDTTRVLTHGRQVVSEYSRP